MPHLCLDCSGNIVESLEPSSLFPRLHAELAKAGQFRVQDFKSRLIRHPDFFIGAGTGDQAFVALDIRTFNGKSPQEKSAISHAALTVLTDYFTDSLTRYACDISVQITEIERASYSRHRSLELVAG